MTTHSQPAAPPPPPTSPAAGLSTVLAAERLAQSGPNEFTHRHRRGVVRLLVKQFRSALVYLLLIATGLSFALKDYDDSLVIIVILLINTGLGFYQEYKSQRAAEKLQGLLSRLALVVRDGHEQQVDERLVVPGDLVILKEGDVAPADLKLTTAEHLSANESQLTGESAPVNKSVGAVIYAGSTIEDGEGSGIVVATGYQTEIGKIAHLSASTVRVTQYERSLSTFSSFLMKLSLVSLTVVFALKLFISGDFSHITTLALFIVALSITVVPEALPVIATVTLSAGALKLTKRHVIAKTLSAVEDLGNITVLCTDKTGTLTENRQTVTALTSSQPELFGMLACASIDQLANRQKRLLGSFDEALLNFIPEETQFKAKRLHRLDEMPFDPPARRRRVVVTDGVRTYLVVMGAVEALLELVPPTHRHRYGKQIQDDEAKGLRHLGLAYREVSYRPGFDILAHEKQLKFLGFVSLVDPLRPTAQHAIQLARELGVGIKILSGDSTAVTGYVARQVGLLGVGDEVFSGEQFDHLSDAEATSVVIKHHAFGRLSPEQKYRIIKLLKLSGEVVGYQGDGINDAPALKLADVAIAVSAASDVAKESADILLLRSDLGVIMNGIRYGRAIFSNINKYIRYTMIGNFGNFFALSVLYLLSLGLPLLPIQLLLTSLLTDVPLVAIATDNVPPEELGRPSKYSAHSLLFVSLILGSVTAFFEVAFFAVTRSQTTGLAQTSLFLFLTMLQLVVIFSVRNKGHFWRAPRLSTGLKVSFAVVALVSTALVYWSFSRHLFQLVPLPAETLGLIVVMSGLYVFGLDVVKVWFYRLGLAQ